MKASKNIKKNDFKEKKLKIKKQRRSRLREENENNSQCKNFKLSREIEHLN